MSNLVLLLLTISFVYGTNGDCIDGNVTRINDDASIRAVSHLFLLFIFLNWHLIAILFFFSISKKQKKNGTWYTIKRNIKGENCAITNVTIHNQTIEIVKQIGDKFDEKLTGTLLTNGTVVIVKGNFNMTWRFLETNSTNYTTIYVCNGPSRKSNFSLKTKKKFFFFHLFLNSVNLGNVKIETIDVRRRIKRQTIISSHQYRYVLQHKSIDCHL